MYFLSTFSIFALVFVFTTTSFAIPTIDPSANILVPHDLPQAHASLLNTTSFSRREIGFVDHNARWRTHYTSITVGVPVTAAAVTCSKLLRFIVIAYVPRNQSNPKLHRIPVSTGAFQILFASTQAIDWADLASYAEALLASPIATSMAGLWEVS